MNRIVHFEIQADEPKRAAKFYGDVFGWKFEEYKGLGMEYWGILTAPKDSKEPGINGGLQRRPAKAPGQGLGTNAFVCTIVVDNFDAYSKKIVASGGIVAMPKFAIMSMAWQGYFLDTEGNTFGLHQADPNAK